MKKWVIVTFATQNGYLHVYGPHSKSEALAGAKEMHKDLDRKLGPTEARKQVRIWVRKMVDVDAINASIAGRNGQ